MVGPSKQTPVVAGATDRRSSRAPVRWAYVLLGLVCVGVGGVGAVVPGLPTTVFFIAAAACFTRSSPRLEAWVLRLPGVGPLVRDYRGGLGMPRRAKVAAVAVLLLVGTLSVVVVLQLWWARLAVLTACAVGVAVILWGVPTRERVLRQRRSVE